MKHTKVILLICSFFFLVLGGYFWSKYSSSNQRYIHTILDHANTAKPTQVESLLRDYTINNDLEKTIKNFLQKTVGHGDRATIQSRSSNAAEEGQSGDQLFFVRDKQDNLIFVVKAFGEPFKQKGSFIKELGGFDLTSKIQSKNLHLVTAEAIGKCTISGKNYGLLAMSPAKGMNMQRLVIDIFRQPKESPQRLYALHLAEKATAKLGSALSELHQIRSQKDMPLNPATIQRAQKYLNQVTAHQKHNNLEIDAQKLQAYFSSLTEQIEQVKTIRSIIHGDAHLGNFLYDENTDTVSMVDYNQLHRSIDENGNPLGNGALDVMMTLDIIAANKQYGLTQTEAQLLSKSFVKGYGSLPTQLEQDFFALLSRLHFVAWFWKAEKKNPEQFTDGKIKKVADYMLNEIIKSLAN